MGKGKGTSGGAVTGAGAGNGQGRHLVALAGFVALAFVPTLGAVVARPDAWYQALARPSWNPPPWVFGPVWTTLYATMGLAAWRVWLRGGWCRPLAWWGLQLLLNAAWTPVFFGLHLLGASVVVIVALWLALATTVASFARVDRIAAWTLVPCLAWVTFAAALDAAIWWANRPAIGWPSKADRSTPDCRMIESSVPILSSAWSGTGTVVVVVPVDFCITT